MIDKRVSSVAEAVADIGDGAVVVVSGFGEAGSPTELLHALIDHGAKELTVVNNNAGNDIGLGGDGNDTINCASGADTVAGNEGSDMVEGCGASEITENFAYWAEWVDAV